MARVLPFEGNYSSWLEQKQARLAVEERGVGAPTHARPRARVGAHEPPRAPCQVEGADRRLREAARRRRQLQARGRRDPHPGRAAAGRPGRRGGARREGVRRPAARRGHDVLAAPGRHRRRDRAERRRQDDALQHDRGRGAARQRRVRIGDTVELAYVDQSRGGLDPQNTVWRGSPRTRTSCCSASAR